MSTINDNEDANRTSLVNLQEENNTINEKINDIIFNNMRLKKRVSALAIENDSLYNLLYNM